MDVRIFLKFSVNLKSVDSLTVTYIIGNRVLVSSAELQ